MNYGPTDTWFAYITMTQIQTNDTNRTVSLKATINPIAAHIAGSGGDADHGRTVGPGHTRVPDTHGKKT